MTPRLTKLAALYLLLGLVTTWAVAWGSVFIWRPSRVHPSFLIELGPSPQRAVMVRRCPAGQAMYFNADVESATALREHRDRVKSWPEDVQPAFDQSRFRLAPSITWGEERFEFAVIARGWPRLALHCSLTAEWGYLDRLKPRHAVSIPTSGPLGDELTKSFLLPYLPYWPGLLADTLFYALLFAALHQLTTRARRARRRRRNRCAACGYDLSGLDATPCPECGHTP